MTKRITLDDCQQLVSSLNFYSLKDANEDHYQFRQQGRCYWLMLKTNAGTDPIASYSTKKDFYDALKLCIVIAKDCNHLYPSLFK
jgi:hypothetical protein